MRADSARTPERQRAAGSARTLGLTVLFVLVSAVAHAAPTGLVALIVDARMSAGLSRRCPAGLPGSATASVARPHSHSLAQPLRCRGPVGRTAV